MKIFILIIFIFLMMRQAHTEENVPVKEPTAAPSAEGTASTAPSIPDEEEGGFTPITDIQGSQVPSASPTVAKKKEVTKVITKDNAGNTEVITTTTTIKNGEGNIDITEKVVDVEKSSSFVRFLILFVVFFAIILFVCRKRVSRYFDKRSPYGTYTLVPQTDK